MAIADRGVQPERPAKPVTEAAMYNGDLDNEEWLAWYSLTPQERFAESAKLWEFYLACGGSLDPEPDSQSPFDSLYERRPVPADGRSGVRILRRSRV
jgi:hypothetical protein